MTVALLLAAPAWAQERGFYIGGSIGSFDAGQVCASGGPFYAPGLACDAKDGSWRIFLGYQFNRHIGLELGYADLGSVTLRQETPNPFNNGTVNGTLDAEAWDLVAVASFPLIGNLSVLGKLGAYYARTRLHTDTSDFVSDPDLPSVPIFRGEESDAGATLGLGARYSFTAHLAARLEWQHYDAIRIRNHRVTSFKSDYDVLTLGLQYRF
jgi:OOP family OmpA-OmpF porin